MLCGACGRDLADGFAFCPYCGKPIEGESAGVEMSHPSEAPGPSSDVPNVGLGPEKMASAGNGIQAGTVALGSFAAISLLVSIVKGLVPIYLLEAAGWAGLAWYWQSKKTHSDIARGVVGTLAVLVAVGEVVHIAMQPDSQPTMSQSALPSSNGLAGTYWTAPTQTSATVEGQAAVSPNESSRPSVPDQLAPAKNTADPMVSRRGVDSKPAETVPASTLTECPSSLPSGATARPLPKYAADELVGKQYLGLSQEHTYETNERGDEYMAWSLDFEFTNKSDTCVVMAMVEVDLSYNGKTSRERHTVPFSPLLGPGKQESGFSTVKLNIRSTDRGESPALVGWRTVGVSGFELQ
jgi:hypothetical protein